MSSKLFHTVVGFGIALGAASMGCAAEPTGDDSANSAAADTQTQVDPTQAAADMKQDNDRFCEVAWPTTKGGPRPSDAQDCIDPQTLCGDYPGVGPSGFGGGAVQCINATNGNVNTCDYNETEHWQFCKANADGTHAWACPSGTIDQATCVWPETGATNNQTASVP